MCECKSHIYIFPFYLEIVQEKVKKKKKKKKKKENFTITYLQNDRSCDGPHFSKLSH